MAVSVKHYMNISLISCAVIFYPRISVSAHHSLL